jgi:cytochrome c peroxidase
MDGPAHFPEMEVPAENPLTAEGVELGRYLFHDFRLSINDERSCGICHEPAKGFTDGFVRAIGTTGEVHTRNSLSLINVGHRARLTWRDPEQRKLEDQWHVPMFGTVPVEMGMTADALVERVLAIDRYPPMFAAAFPEDGGEVSVDNIGRALASFQRTIVGGDSPYDRYLLGDDSALSAQAIRGLDLFETLGCPSCHGGIFFDQPTDASGRVTAEFGYENTGLYNTDGEGAYPEAEQGLFALTGISTDMGRYRIPSLRGVAQSGPWSHDGTVLSLADVLDNYARGGRLVMAGDSPGDGAESPLKSERLTGFEISNEERDDIIIFLEALTDSGLLERDDLATPYCLMVDGVAINEPCEAWEPLGSSDSSAER